MRAATAKVPVPAAVARLQKLLVGLPPAERPPPLGFAQRCREFLTMRFLGVAGHAELLPDYFDGEFLAGARYAMSCAPGLIGRGSAASSGFADAKLAEIFNEASAELESGGLSLDWQIEEVVAAELRSLHLVFGLRRQDLPCRDRSAFCTEFAGHRVITRRGQGVRPDGQDLVQSFTHGVTLGAEALITCKQSVILREGDKIVAGSFDAEALHCVRLEAELNESRTVQEDGSERRRLAFNEELGWSISDLNGALDGNCVAEGIPQLTW